MKNVNENAGLDENDNYIHRREQNQPKQKKSRKESRRFNRSKKLFNFSFTNTF